MKRYKRIAVALTFVLMFCLVLPINTKALEGNNQITFSIEKLNDEVVEKVVQDINSFSPIMPVVDNGVIKLGNHIFHLFVTFENNDKALEMFKEKYSNELQTLSEYYSLDRLIGQQRQLVRILLYI